MSQDPSVPAPRPPTTSAVRPASSRRARGPRPSSARPDTSASGIGPLPDQQFFPEGEDLSEEEDEYSDEPEEDGVFAFARPVTGAVPNQPFSDAGTSAPNTAGVQPTTAGTHFSGGTFGVGAGSPNVVSEPFMAPTGLIDVGGHMPDVQYDRSRPPPFSGVHNPNNSVFAFQMGRVEAARASRGAGNIAQVTANAPPLDGGQRPPSTGRSLLDRFRGRTATSAMTGTSTTAITERTSDEDELSDAASFTSATGTGTSGKGSMGMMGQHRPKGSRRMKSSTPLIPGTATTDGTSELVSSIGGRGLLTRGSYALTELSGDATIPDGKTTFGDGLGGMDPAIAEFVDLVEEDSPYPEVRASVSNIDDPEMPALTFRSWFLGMLFAILGSAINTFFSFRTPAPYISPLIIQVVAYPFGKFFAWALPIRTFYLPSFLGSHSFSFNPGPFNIKEHTIIVIMTNVAVGPAYALYATVSSELYYGRDFGIGFSILFVLATQITGFSFAGLTRRFVVWPASMIWPGNLAATTSLNTFHAEEDGFMGGMTRFRFLILSGCGAFAWYFLPGFLFSALSYFSYACWIAPNNAVVNQLFGVSTGLGMGLLTFDWTQITWLGSPLVAPWWAEVNIGIGFILFYWIIVPIMYYTNVWQTAYLPISVIQSADRFGSEYDIFNILTPDIQLNKTAYALYSPVYLSASFSMTFMLAFALSTALIVHTILHHGPRIYRAILNSKSEADDIHMKLMRHYPEVPDWWYAAMFAVCFVLAIVGIEVFHTGLPVWGYLISVLLPFIYILPAAFVYAMTSQAVAINLLCELIPGYIFQGKPIPGMIFKVFSVQTASEALGFIQDLKLGHYMKIPPRATFIAQLSAATVACFVQVGTRAVLFKAVPDMCSPHQKDLLMCNNTKVFFTSSIVWGLIGPERLFSNGSLYHPQVYAALFGALAPIPVWLWVRRHPRSFLRNLNLPVVFNGATQIPPATGINYASWLITGFVFQFWIRRYRFAWWSKYNYVLSAGLDVGTALSALAIFLFLSLPGASLSWWGNTVFVNTLDWGGVAHLQTPETGFGPDTWKV